MRIDVKGRVAVTPGTVVLIAKHRESRQPGATDPSLLLAASVGPSSATRADFPDCLLQRAPAPAQGWCGRRMPSQDDSGVRVSRAPLISLAARRSPSGWEPS